MEKKQKDSIVTFMMVVGVVFVLIAGCIFVKQAWEYLPDFVKQICLLGVGIGALTGSYAARKNELLKKTETALFYIGDVFIGYFMWSVTGNKAFEMLDLNDPLRMFIVTVTLLAPIGIHLYERKRVAEYIISLVLVNLGIIFLLVGLEAGISSYLICVAFVTLILGVINHFGETLGMVTKIAYLVHEIYSVLWLFSIAFVKSMINAEITVEENIVFLMLVVCVVLSGIVWYDKNSKDNIIQAIVLGFIFVIMLGFNMVCGTIIDALVLGIIAFLVMILAGNRNDKIFVVISTIALILIGLYVTRDFWTSIAWWVYMFVAGIVLILLAIKKEGE